MFKKVFSRSPKGIKKVIPRSIITFVIAIILVIGFIPFSTIPTYAAPADCYWVGDGGNWTDALNHWAVVSGGAPGGGNLPDNTSDVHFDPNSFTIGGQTVTMDADAACKDFTMTGATDSPNFAFNPAFDFDVYGDVTLISAMTMSSTAQYGIEMNGVGTIITGGLTLSQRVLFKAAAGLGDELTSSSFITLNGNVTLTTNNHNITCTSIGFGQANPHTINLGSSTITTGAWSIIAGTLTVNAGTSTIKITGTGVFDGGDQTYNDVELSGTVHTITGNNTYNDLKFNNAGIQTITFTDGTTQTVNTLTRNAGIAVKTLQGSGVGGWNITDADGGTNNVEYISISRSTAAPINTFYAGASSTDGGNNNNWFFNDVPLTTTTNVTTGVTMNAGGVTGGTFNGSIAAVVGSVSITTRFEYGLTVAYGSQTGDIVVTTTGAFTGAVPNNLTPGATYHFRAVGVNDGGTYNGADGTFTFTLPTVASLTPTNVIMSGLTTTATLQGNLTNMGVASSANVRFEWGYSTAYGNNTAWQVGGVAVFTATINNYNPSETVHYRFISINGAVVSSGGNQFFQVTQTPGWSIIILLPIIFSAVFAIMAVYLVVTTGSIGITFVVLGIVTFIIIQLLLSMWWV